MSPDDVFRLVTFLIIGALVAFQTLHYTVASRRFFSTQSTPRRALLAGTITLYWVVQGAVLLTVVPMLPFNEFPIIAPALLGPPAVVALALLAPRFRAVADRVSLRWAIASVEGPSRIIVGFVFIAWWARGLLPPIFAWVAGPGDILGGVLAYFAMRELAKVADACGLAKKHWSVTDVLRELPESLPEAQLRALRRSVITAIALVAVGIADFFAAPASAAISLLAGNPATALARRPLGFVPMLLVPQVFVLEVLAMRQLHVMRVKLNEVTVRPEPVV